MTTPTDKLTEQLDNAEELKVETRPRDQEVTAGIISAFQDYSSAFKPYEAKSKDIKYHEINTVIVQRFKHKPDSKVLIIGLDNENLIPSLRTALCGIGKDISRSFINTIEFDDGGQVYSFDNTKNISMDYVRNALIIARRTEDIEQIADKNNSQVYYVTD
jgi:hypothetical protein